MDSTMQPEQQVNATVNPKAILTDPVAVNPTRISKDPIKADQFDVIARICGLKWSGLGQADLLRVAQSYYFFSVQFRENLQVACELHPFDANLKELESQECNTANLSPWPGVAAANEKMNHDEFMRRLLDLSPARESRSLYLDNLGNAYLAAIRKITPATRAMSIGSYEGGGLERIFSAFLSAPDWDNPPLRAFQHFLIEHLRFDSDPDQGHGALSRHLAPDERVIPLWMEFERLLIKSVPNLAT